MPSRDLGQSIWLDNITRALLDEGTLQQYIDDFDVTGLTSNPTIYDRAIGGATAYDDQIAEATKAGRSGEDTFFELALADLRRAADLFRPVYDRTNGVDGFVSLEVSPLLAYDATTTAGEALRLHGSATGRTCSSRSRARQRACPRSSRRSPRASRSTSRCCSRRRSTSPRPTPTRAASSDGSTQGLTPDVRSVASLFVSRWDPITAQPAPGRPARRHRPRGRPAGVPRLVAFFSLRALAAAARRRAPARSVCCSRAPAPRTRQRPAHQVRPRARGAEHGRHDARGDPPRDRRRRAAGRAVAERMPPRPAIRWRRSWPPASTSTQWPPSSSARAPRASSGRGRRSWSGSRARSPRSPDRRPLAAAARRQPAFVVFLVVARAVRRLDCTFERLCTQMSRQRTGRDGMTITVDETHAGTRLPQRSAAGLHAVREALRRRQGLHVRGRSRDGAGRGER